MIYMFIAIYTLEETIKENGKVSTRQDAILSDDLKELDDMMVEIKAGWAETIDDACDTYVTGYKVYDLSKSTAIKEVSGWTK